jgi:hypothetical protein
MAGDIFEAGVTKTTGAAAGMIAAIQAAALSSTVRMPEVREIGIFNQSGVAATVGLVWATSTGTTPSGGVTVANSQNGGSGNTIVYPTYSTYPTIAGTPVYTRRADIQAVAGAGIIWTWLPGEWPLWGGSSNYPFMIYQISALAVTFDCYVKVAE